MFVNGSVFQCPKCQSTGFTFIKKASGGYAWYCLRCPTNGNINETRIDNPFKDDPRIKLPFGI